MKDSPFNREYFKYYGGLGPFDKEKFYAFNDSVAEEIVKRIAPKKTLDAGCGKGFLVEAMRKRGVEAYGMDISAYAIAEVAADVRQFCSVSSLTEPMEEHYDLITCIEVLEHLPEEDAIKAVKKFCLHSKTVLFSSMANYLHPDDTHINLHPREYWIELFRRNGFDLDSSFDASFITQEAMKFDKKNLTVTFLLSGAGVSGGVRVILEYCNRLGALGHNVNLALLSGPKPDWFQVDSEVNIIETNEESYEKDLPPADVLVATLSTTAPLVLSCSPEKGEKFYFVQHYEPAVFSHMRTLFTYWLPLKKFTVSTWLQRTIEETVGERVGLVFSGINFKHFYPAPEVRRKYNIEHVRVGMMYDSQEFKGALDGLECIRMVKEMHPQVKAILLGPEPKPAEVSCDEYWHNPPQEKIYEFYNSCNIFISPSWLEGFGLPTLEAMACAIPAACTDARGNRDYAINGETALVSPWRRPDLLAQNVVRLIEDEGLRETIRLKGHKKALEFTWEMAVENLIGFFLRTYSTKSWRDEVLLNLTKQLASLERDYRKLTTENAEMLHEDNQALLRLNRHPIVGPVIGFLRWLKRDPTFGSPLTKGRAGPE